MEGPVIFVRVGWMETYQGSRTLERPIGGGKYTRHEIGVEKDNFLPDAYGRLQGYFAVGKGSQSINLFRVDGRQETKKLDKLSPVLVIFVATHHENGGGVIVGWYRNARLFRHEQTGLNGHEFRVEADARDAVLVPADKRSEFRVPRASPDVSAMGHSNVFYLFDERGQPRSLPWAQKLITRIVGYAGDNALNPEVSDVADPVTSAEIQEERRAGFTSNPKLRKAIEERAMRVVEQYYKEKLGFSLEDRSKHCSYDFCYTDQQTQYFIEVKGSQQEWPVIILTPKEVAFARENWKQMELCVVHSIVVDGDEEPEASGGILKRFPQWNPDHHQLAATQYQCDLNRDLAVPK